MIYATFGVGHPLGNHYAAMDTDDESAARDLMFKVYGKSWAFMYGEGQKKDCIDKYALQEIGVFRLHDGNWRLET